MGLFLFCSAPGEWGARTASACSSPNGRAFFAELQRGGFAAPRGGARGQTPAVSTLLTPVSLYFLVGRIPETGDRFETGERQRIFLPCLSQPIRRGDTVLLHIRLNLRRVRHNSAA